MPSQQASKKPMKAQQLSKEANQARESGVVLPTCIHSNSKAIYTPQQVNCAVGNSPFGYFFLAATEIGVCQLDFIDDRDITNSISKLGQTWPEAKIINQPSQHLSCIENFFQGNGPITQQLSLHLIGSEFQLKVWRAMLGIPSGSICTYAEVAKAVGQSKAVRAVGTAIGANPVAFFVPCHRVVRKDGTLGGYRWGVTRKQALQNWEQAKTA